MMRINLYFNILLGILFMTSLKAEIQLSHDLLENSQIVNPSEEFRENPNIQSFDLFKEADENREQFWENQAQCLEWFQPWSQVLEWNRPMQSGF